MSRSRTMLTQSSSVLALVGVLCTVSCSAGESSSRECNVNADCVTGVCSASGECLPGTAKPDAQADAAGGEAGIDASEGGEEAQAPDGSTVDGGGCTANYDGVITGAELPFGAGRQAMYRVSKDVDPFTSAADCSGTPCKWDLVDVGGTTAEELTVTESLEGKWYADEPAFANATYVAQLAEVKIGVICDQIQMGVFQVAADGLLLLGTVSQQVDGGTKLIYDPPVTILKFPLQVGLNWKQDAVAKGKLCNSMFDYQISQTFTSNVDATGEVTTPYGTFQQVLRVNTLMERHLSAGVTATTQRTHTFVSECHTTIATAVSKEGESAAEFGAASQVSRLSVFP